MKLVGLHLYLPFGGYDVVLLQHSIPIRCLTLPYDEVDDHSAGHSLAGWNEILHLLAVADDDVFVTGRQAHTFHIREVEVEDDMVPTLNRMRLAD
jgi:hypothetical protein